MPTGMVVQHNLASTCVTALQQTYAADYMMKSPHIGETVSDSLKGQHNLGSAKHRASMAMTSLQVTS